MRKSLLQLCIIFYILPLQSQTYDYVAIGFDDITPAWRHLTIDSTIIGYTDTAGFKAKNEEQRIGRDHWHYTSQLIYP